MENFIFCAVYNLKSLLRLKDFQQLNVNILQVRGEQDGMTIAFLRNITAELSMLAAVRHKNVNLHL